MNQFTMKDALAICTANINSRKTVARTSYVLYYSHNEHRYEGKLTGSTVKSLINEFRVLGGNYKYAVITKVGDDKPLRFFNRELSKKFFSMTRTGKKKVA